MLGPVMGWFHKLSEAGHDFLRRHGLTVGVPTIGGGVVLDVNGHTLHWLTVASLCVGILSTTTCTAIRVVEFVRSLKADRK